MRYHGIAGLDLTEDGYICQGCGHRWKMYLRDGGGRRRDRVYLRHEGPRPMSVQEARDHARTCVERKLGQNSDRM